MVHLTESSSWQRATQVAREYSRWPLGDADVEQHLGLSYDYMVAFLGGPRLAGAAARPVGRTAAQDRQGAAAPRAARHRAAEPEPSCESAAQEHFGLPDRPLTFWPAFANRLPWRAPESAAPSPRALVSGDR